MKNLILIIAAVFSMNVAFASNIGDGTLTLVKSEKLELTMENESQSSLILSSDYNEVEENVSLKFEQNVDMVQVFNKDGELEMMIPIGSKNVSLGMSLFESGAYKMGFMVEGMDEVQFTNLTIR